jgi:CheY-like chemotaxis protein
MPLSQNHLPCILIMDDEEHIRNIIKKMLEKFGYTVVSTDNGQEALTLYQARLDQKNPFGLVILDLIVPSGMGGKETSEKILALDPQARILAASGDGADPVMADPAAFGLAGILPKPFRLAELKQIVEQALA